MDPRKLRDVPFPVQSTALRQRDPAFQAALQYLSGVDPADPEAAVCYPMPMPAGAVVRSRATGEVSPLTAAGWCERLKSRLAQAKHSGELAFRVTARVDGDGQVWLVRLPPRA